MKNKIIAHLSIIMILVGVFSNVCTTYNRISIYDSSVYAEADNWTSCDSSDLVTAFRYYCKSRNLVIEGSIADALTTFTTSSFNNICSTLGIDTTQLQAELKKTTEGNLGLRFLFSNTGITAYNRIFSEFLQNNNLDVGDEVDNEVIKSGEWFVDADGNGCYVYEFDSSTGSQITKQGSKYRFNGLQLYSMNNSNFVCNLTDTQSETFRVGVNSGSSSIRVYYNSYSGIVYNPNNDYQRGELCIGRFPDSNGLYVSTWSYRSSSMSQDYVYHASLVKIQDGETENANVYITTNNNTINNNTYNNNFTIIYNDGDTYITDDDDEPLPTTPPSGDGGGGGGDNPSNPDIPPVDPTPTPTPTIPDWDIELPEMPTGNDWLLYGLEKKFPWDIPYNLMYMLSLFAADPETPHFEGTLDFKIVQWDYDIDLAPFDDIAGYVRDMEFIGFLLGLMLLTRKLIWG